MDAGANFVNRGTRPARKFSDGIGPVPSVLIIAIGALFGLGVMPADAQPAGAMRTSAIALTFSLLLVPAIEALALGVKPALKIRNLLLAGIVYWLLADLIQGLYDIDATPHAVEIAFLATGLFAVGISLGGAIRSGGMPAGIRRLARLDLSDRQILACTAFCFVAGVFYYIYMAGFSPSRIIEGLLYSDRFSAPWARGALGDWRSFLEQLSYFGYLLPLFTAVMYMRSRTLLSAKTVFCALLSACHLAFLAQGGGRTAIGAVLGAAILVGIHLTRRTVRPIHFIPIFAALFVAQVTMNVMLENRSIGLGKLEVSDWTFSRIRVDDNFYRLAQTTDFVPLFFPYSGLQFVYFSLVRPIPRALWPGKPVYQGFTVQQALGDTDTSFTNSVIGEAYSGFGFPLVFAMGMFFGLAARWWEQTLEDHPTSGGVMVYALGAMALFTALRGFVNIVLFSYPILSLWAAAALFRLTRARLVRGRRFA